MRLILFNRSKPSFIIIGGVKCATTTLWQILRQHPQIYPSILAKSHDSDSLEGKELNFFQDTSLFHSRGIKQYWAKFPKLKRGEICFEATPNYLYHGCVAGRIKQLIPNCKIICLVRNPIDRAWSDYHYFIPEEERSEHDFMQCVSTYLRLDYKRDIGNETIAETRIREAQERESGSRPQDLMVKLGHQLIDKSLYAKWLIPYIKAFKPERIMIVPFENFVRNITLHIHQICNFLGVDQMNESQYPEKLHWNETKKSELSIRNRRMIVPHFIPYNSSLYNHFARDLQWR